MTSKSICSGILALALPLLVACSAVEDRGLQSASLIVTNGVVVDGTGAEPIADGLVAVKGDRFVAVGQSADYEIPEGVPVIDARGGTILPGVINAHVHLAAGAGTRRVSFLLDGVTSVCDLGAPLVHMAEFEKEDIKSGPAARGFKAGPIVTVPGGYPGPYMGTAISYEIQGAGQAEDAVRDLHARGADYIKVSLETGYLGDTLPVMDLEELRSIVETAHATGLLVRAHADKNTLLDMAVEAGVDVIEHAPTPSDLPQDLELMFDDSGVFQLPGKLQAQLQRLIDQGVIIVPTLDVYQGRKIAPEMGVNLKASLEVVKFLHNAGASSPWAMTTVIPV